MGVERTGKEINGIWCYDPQFRCYVCAALATEDTYLKPYPTCEQHTDYGNRIQNKESKAD